ncbi:MAG: hypothetical protein UZ10_BCD003002276 [Bacteroidetes bacterium OLB10]|nr:MAG: hypothetical protein UZ10_BCD003002276 [Bacteroidetes bacterium OLB10]
MRKLYSLIFILFLSPAVLNAQYANSWINFNGSQPYSAQQYFKIKVWKKGIYRLDYSTLQQAGFNVTQNPHNFQIFHNGTEQYIYVAGEATTLLTRQIILNFMANPMTDGPTNRCMKILRIS